MQYSTLTLVAKVKKVVPFCRAIFHYWGQKKYSSYIWRDEGLNSL